MAYWCKDLQKGFKEDPITNKAEYDWKLHETWEDYPVPKYDAVHTYCQVAFDNSGKTFYYRTRNPYIRVGDAVLVPVGYSYRRRVGVIVSMRSYVGYNAPYPLEKTKHIIGKAAQYYDNTVKGTV